MNGYIALISVLIIAALAILIAFSASLIGLGESGMALQEGQSWETFYLTNLCAEDALMKLKNDLNYGGNETLTFESGTCTILSIEGIGNKNRVIKVLGTAFNKVRKIRIEINRVNPEMEIKSWSEVTAF